MTTDTLLTFADARLRDFANSRNFANLVSKANEVISGRLGTVVHGSKAGSGEERIAKGQEGQSEPVAIVMLYCHECREWAEHQEHPDLPAYTCLQCGEDARCDDCGGQWYDDHVCV